MSPLAARVAATYLAMQDDEPGQETRDQVALPKGQTGKMPLVKSLEGLLQLLEKGDHGGFKRALQNLNDLFKRVDDNFEAAWIPKSVDV